MPLSWGSLNTTINRHGRHASRCPPATDADGIATLSPELSMGPFCVTRSNPTQHNPWVNPTHGQLASWRLWDPGRSVQAKGFQVHWRQAVNCRLQSLKQEAGMPPEPRSSDRRRWKTSRGDDCNTVILPTTPCYSAICP